MTRLVRLTARPWNALVGTASSPPAGQRVLCLVLVATLLGFAAQGAVATEGQSLEVAGAPGSVAVRVAVEDLDTLPLEIQGQFDPCASEVDAAGKRHAILFLNADQRREMSRQRVLFDDLGPVAEHLRRFAPLRTLQRNSVPSIEKYFTAQELKEIRAAAPAGRMGHPCINPNIVNLTYDEYHPPATGDCLLLNLTNRFPDLVEMVVIGESIEGRPIHALKITDEPLRDDPTEESIVFTGITHAREWVTYEMMLYLAESLLTRYETDSRIRHIVDNSVVWLVPVVNPDGHLYSWNEERFWRKNRRPDPMCDGVDINRNYDYDWGMAGSHGFQCSETYRGAFPASEPETQAIQELLQDQKPAVAVSYHNYSQLVLFPWGHTTQVTPESFTSLRAMGHKYSDLVYDHSGFSYTPGQSSYTIYLTSGAFDDYAYGAQGALSFTPELRPASFLDGGFALPEDQILPTLEENFEAALWLMTTVADARFIRNPRSDRLIEFRGRAGHDLALPLTPANQDPEVSVHFPSSHREAFTTWMDDREHAPPFWGDLFHDVEAMGSGGGYRVWLPNEPILAGWAESLRRYKALPGVFEDGAEIMLSNVEKGAPNFLGIPSLEPVKMSDIVVFRRELDLSRRLGERIIETRSALQDMERANPWINWRWAYRGDDGEIRYAHPLGRGGADPYVYPFRTYRVVVNKTSFTFASSRDRVFLLRFPGTGSGAAQVQGEREANPGLDQAISPSR